METVTPVSSLPPMAELNFSAVNLPQNLAPITNSLPNTTPPPAAPSPPPFINSIAELKDLSASIAAFQQCYEDLHNHIDSIKAAILSKLSSGIKDITPLPSSTVEITPLPVSKVEVSPLPVATVENSNLSGGDVSNEKVQDQSVQVSELEGLCKTMCSRGIRRYLVFHLSDLAKLREEVPKALKLAPNPAKLALESLGKFYLQGTKAFTRDSPMIPAREASIFVLECFLLMVGMVGKDNGALDIEKSVKEDAEAAALGWRKRLLTEGGLAQANQIDARGLLLLVACFGIPSSFKREDIRDLVMAANAKEIVGVLKNSQVLMNIIPDIVGEMMKKKMEVDVVDIVYTFGLEEKFDPQIILLSYLQESSKKPKKASGSAASLNEANRKQLAALKSVSKCLQRHNIDPAKLLPGWQIKEKISTLEKEVGDFNRTSGDKSSQKRKASEAETSKKSKTKETKRSRYPDHGPQQQKAVGHADSRRNMLPSHAGNYSASPSVVYGGPGAGLLPESMISPGIGTSISANRGSALSAHSYPGVHFFDSAGQFVHRVSQPYVYDAALVEKYAARPPVGLTSLYGASASSTGVPSSSPMSMASRSSGADLYQFADSVVERESYASSVPRSVGTIPTAVPGHHPSVHHPSGHHPSYMYPM